jgi:hypothetical protein
MPRERIEAMIRPWTVPAAWGGVTASLGARIRRRGLSAGVMVVASLGAREARAQQPADVATIYLREGAVIRGEIIADNGPNGIRIRSQKSGATFLVPAAQVDSVVREIVPAGNLPVAVTAVPSPAPTPSPAVVVAARVPAPVPVTAPVPTPAAMAAISAPAPAPDPVPVPAVPVPQVHVPAPVAAPAPAPVPIAVPVAVPDTVPDTVPASPAGAPMVPSPAFVEGLAPPPSAPDTATLTSTVTFISGTEIYIGAGRLDGLVEGAVVSVVHGDVVVAKLRVKFLASHRSACEWVEGANDIVLGDVVSYHRQAATTVAAVAPRARRPRRMSGPGLHGRFGSRYLSATTTTAVTGQPDVSNGFTQPSMDARINGTALGNTPVGLALDVRARQTTTTSAGVASVDGHTRVYQAVLLWNTPGAGFHAAAGRQYLTSVSSVGLFDGALIELTGPHLTFGAFGGYEPDLANLTFSSAVHDFGTYVTLHNRPGGLTARSFTLGAVGSYEGGKERREWGIAQVSLNNRYLALYVLQELDYFRPWKRQGLNAEKHAFSGTSQFVSASVRTSRWLSLNGTYDKRRSVPTIRDFTNPETNFDDAYRAGYGVGVQLTGRQLYASGDWRKSTGGSAGGANSYTATAGVSRLTRLNFGLSARATWYRNGNDSSASNPLATRTSGQLYSGRLSIDPVGLIHVDLNAGRRQERNPIATSLQHSTWYGVDIDMNLARSWFLSFSGLGQKDPANPGTSTLTQVYGGVTWRF